MVKLSSAQVKIPYREMEFRGHLVYGSEKQLKRKVVLPVSVSLECGGIKLVGVDAYRGLAFGLNWDTVVRENMDGYLLDNADALRYFSGRVKGLVPRDMDKGGTLLLAFYHLISLSEALSVKPVYVEASASIGGTIYSGSMCVAHYVTHEVDRRDFFRIGIERDRWRMRISEVQIKSGWDLKKIKKEAKIITPDTPTLRGKDELYRDVVFGHLGGDMAIYELLHKLGFPYGSSEANIGFLTRPLATICGYTVRIHRESDESFELELPISSRYIREAKEETVNFINAFK